MRVCEKYFTREAFHPSDSLQGFAFTGFGCVFSLSLSLSLFLSFRQCKGGWIFLR